MLWIMHLEGQTLAARGYKGYGPRIQVQSHCEAAFCMNRKRQHLGHRVELKFQSVVT